MQFCAKGIPLGQFAVRKSRQALCLQHRRDNLSVENADLQFCSHNEPEEVNF